jgi:hypothetical protein
VGEREVEDGQKDALLAFNHQAHRAGHDPLRQLIEPEHDEGDQKTQTIPSH